MFTSTQAGSKMEKFLLVFICIVASACASCHHHHRGHHWHNPHNDWNKNCDHCHDTVYNMTEIPTNATLGDHPVWISGWKAFVGIDLFAERWCIWKLDYDTRKLSVGELEGASKASFIVPIHIRSPYRGRFSIGIERKVVEYEWSGKCFSKARRIRTIFKVEQNPLIYGNNHMLDGKTDPEGRLYAQTYSTKLCGEKCPNAGLYRCDGLGHVTRIFKNHKIPNGMAWNPKTNKFYFFDSCDYNIRECCWNPICGSITNCRCVIELEKSYDYCFSGMEIDRHGYLLVCVYNRNLVYQICTVTARIIRKIRVRVPTINSLAFGGPCMRDLLVISAKLRFNLTAGTASTVPNAGSMFLLWDTCSSGYEMKPARYLGKC